MNSPPDGQYRASVRDADDSVLEPQVDPTAQAIPAAPGAPRPNLDRLTRAVESAPARSVGITILAVLAVLYTLYFARAVLLPITFALLLSFLFSPVTRALARARIPQPGGAAIVVAALIALIVIGIYGLSVPAQSWVERAPRTLAAAEAKLRKIRKPVEQVTRTAEQVEQATRVGGPPATREVIVRQPSLAARLFGTTEAFFATLAEIIVLLYFLLAVGDLFLQKLVSVLPHLGDKRKAVEIARAAEASISTYLLTVLLVNVVEGLLVAVAMWLIGLPNPLLWGALAAALEFIPYLGSATMLIMLTLAGVTTFDGIGHELLVPGTFLAINLIQANVVSPMLLGERLTLNPVAIIIGLSLWYFLWGIPGAFLAVPILSTFKIICDHVDTLAPVGEFLGRREEGERRRAVRAGEV